MAAHFDLVAELITPRLVLCCLILLSLLRMMPERRYRASSRTISALRRICSKNMYEMTSYLPWGVSESVYIYIRDAMVAGHAMVMQSSGEPRGRPGAIPGGRSRGNSRNLSFWLIMVTLQVAGISGDTAIHEPMYEPLRNSTNGFLQLHETQATQGRMLQVADTLSDTGHKPELVLPRGHSTVIAR